MANSTHKYRLAFTVEELEYLDQILTLHFEDPENYNVTGKSILTNTRVLLARLSTDSARPAYVVSAKAVESKNRNMELRSLADRRRYCYEKYNTDVDSCTEEEIEMALTYMYHEGMLSKEEATAFEIRYLF